MTDAGAVSLRDPSCVFCDGGPLTREHVWPDWVRALLYPQTQRDQGPLSTQMRGSGRPGEEFVSWEMPSLSLKVRAVCGPRCNHGWMSELEEAARPSLSRMILGQPVALDKKAQAIVARWCVKTAMMFALATPRRGYIAPREYRYLFMNRRPPPSTQVWIGIRTAEEGVTAGVFESLALKDDLEAPDVRGRAYVLTLGIGHFMASLFGHNNLPFEMPWTRPAAAYEAIWPTADPEVHWPPSSVFGPLEELADDPAFAEHVGAALRARRIEIVPASFLP